MACPLMLPDLWQRANEYFGRPVDLLCSADVTRDSCWEDGNAACEARGLGSTDPAFDQCLACSS